MCDVIGGLGCVTKCDREEGRSELAKNSVTYFMDGSLHVAAYLVYVLCYSSLSSTIPV